MLNRKLILLFVIVLLSITSLALAQEREIKDYKVQKGDTLWDISNMELNDPFLWPKVWKENPGIANPDKLMPGQTIKIPLYLIQKDAQMEAPVMEAPVAEPVVEAPPQRPAPVPIAEPAPEKIKPLVDANLFMSSGYITDAVNEIGRVVGSPTKKNLSGLHDYLYIDTKEPVKVGDRFYIVRAREIIHPVKKSRVGDLVQMRGVAEVAIIKQGETVAKIVKSFDEVITGNLLIPYSPMTPPVVPKPYRKPNIEGYIVAAHDMKLNSAQFDIVYIDKGKLAGLEVGDILRAISVEKQLEGVTRVEHKYPHGVVQLIKVLDTTSVAIILKSIDSILPGYHVIQYD